MAEFKKTQLLTLSLITSLLFLTPLLSSSLRSTYLYFITNLFIIYLGLEAGFFSPSSSSPSPPPMKDPRTDTKSPSHDTNITPKAVMVDNPRGDNGDVFVFEVRNSEEKVIKMEEKVVIEDVPKVKKCSSKPSIFFIESKVEEVEEVEEEREKDNDKEEEEEEELFVKAELFIGNFYKQLRMQREDSWRRIHRFYQG